MLKRLVLTGVLLLIILNGTSSEAKSIYNNYIYLSDGTIAAAPEAVVLTRTIYGQDLNIGSFQQPNDLHISDEIIYIADTGNNRIVIIDKDYRLLKIIESFDNNGEMDYFSSPGGVFVDNEGNLNIADTNNSRIVILDFEGNLRRIIGKPESNIFPEEFVFRPTKVVVDSARRFYVVSRGFNMGLIVLDQSGEFIEAMGAARVSVNWVEYFWKRISTREQQDRMRAFIPTEYNNIALHDYDFIFATSSTYDLWQYLAGTISPIRKLNALGNDIIRVTQGIRPYGDTRVVSGGNFEGPSRLVDVTYLGNDMFAILDSNRCRVFVYNSFNVMMFMFGGPGENKGLFSVPSALEYYENTFMVVDSSKNNISIFELSEYGKLVMNTSQYNYELDFEGEEGAWEDIFKLNNNKMHALTGLGLSAYRREDFTEAMSYFYEADNKMYYSKAFEMQRSIFIADNFSWIVFGLFCLVILVVISSLFYKKYVVKKIDSRSYIGTLIYSKHVIFRPLDGFWDLKYEKRGSFEAGITILALAVLVVVVNSFFRGFIFQSTSREDINLVYEIFKVILPFFLFCACNWAVTSLMDGEGNFKNIFMATSYALTPIVIIYPIVTVLSRIMTINELDFYAALMGLAFLWTLVLIICSNNQIHNYNMSKTILVNTITVIVMLLAVFIVVLIFALYSQISEIVKEIYTEISLRR